MHGYTEWDIRAFANADIEEIPNLEQKLTTEDKLKVKFINRYQELLIAFLSSYMADCEFNAVGDSLSKKRNRHITERYNLRLLFTKMEPDINKLLKVQQPQSFN